MYKTISILVVLIILIVSAIVCLLSFRLWSPDKPIVSARLGNDAVIIKGYLSDYQRATDKPSQLLLLHAKCGAIVVEQDADSHPVNPTGQIGSDGHFVVEAKNVFLAQSRDVGLRALDIPSNGWPNDFITLGFFAQGGLRLLLGSDQKPINISRLGEISNAGELLISSTVGHSVVVVLENGGRFVGGGRIVIDHSC